MTLYTYNNNIPFASNNPSTDQPNMQTNTNSISALIGVDHVGFNSSGSGAGGNGGHHLQVTFDQTTTQTTPSNPQTILYTAAGTADATTPQAFFVNKNATVPISLIKAFVVFSFTGSSITILNKYNVTGVTFSAGPLYNVTTTSGAISGGSVPGILIQGAAVSAAGTIGYTWVSPTVTITNVGASNTLTVLFLQA